MIPVSLYINKFKAIKKELYFEFPEEPGLYFIYGNNKVQTKLEGNAVCKTTLWDALCWCLFEKTIKGVGAGDVSPWGMAQGNTNVLFTFVLQGEQHTVERNWKPNNVTLNGKQTTNLEIQDLLGHTFDSFLNSVLIGQDMPMFLDLKPTEKTALMSAVLQLEKWDEYSAKASKELKEIEEGAEKTALLMAKLQGRLEEIDLDALKEKDKKWQADKQFQLQMLEDDFEFEAQQEKDLKAELEIENKKVKLNSKGIATPELILIDTTKLEKELARAEADLDDARRTIKRATNKLNNLEEVCPTCQRPHDSTTLAISKKELNREIKQAQKLIDEDLQEHMEQLTKKINKAVAQNAAIRAEYDEAVLKANQILKKQIELKTKLQACVDNLDKIITRTERIEGSINPYKEEIEKTTEKKQTISSSIKDLEEHLVALKSKKEITSYWVKGFKDLKLFLISEALTQFELEANSALIQLGLVDWKIEFDVDGMTKGGKLKRGFTVTITSPEVENPVVFESWSGGEAQRLKLAVQMGFSNLITNSLGVDNYLEVWDESSNYLSPRGIEDLMESLRDRAISQGKTIFVIDHHTIQSGAFTRKYEMVRDAKGVLIKKQ